MLRGAAAIQQQVQQKKGIVEAHTIKNFFKPCSEQRYQNNLVSSYNALTIYFSHRIISLFLLETRRHYLCRERINTTKQ